MTIVRAADIVLTDADLAQAGALFGIQELTPIGGFENLLFRSTTPTGRVLRITHTSRRNQAVIEAEFGFMDHLSRQGVPVVAPIPSNADALVETLTTAAGHELAVVCMTEAEGGPRSWPDWTDANIESYGALLGAMHESAATHNPSSRAVQRPPWNDPIFDVGLSNVEKTHSDLLERHAQIVTAAETHPAGATDLLIHRDIHIGNLFISEAATLTVFDFGDSAYGTATHDVAIVLFYWLFIQEADPIVEAQRFLSRFFDGYHRHARLPRNWAEGADLFLSHREIELYWLLGPKAADTTSPYASRFLAGRRERVLAGVPYLGVALSEVVDS